MSDPNDTISIKIEIVHDPVQDEFTALVPSIPAYGRGNTKEAAIAELEKFIRLHAETFGTDVITARLTLPVVTQQVSLTISKDEGTTTIRIDAESTS